MCVVAGGGIGRPVAKKKSASSSYERIYAAVRKIPHGRVTTYGAIARIAGLDRHARLVGYALSALHAGSVLPWHRVINAQGKLSLELAGSSSGLTQRLRLEKEGVRVDAAGRVSLAQYGWRVRATTPRTKRSAEAI
jgi:methylated-DNA-protein-cysteine methyltransferase related protein